MSRAISAVPVPQTPTTTRTLGSVGGGEKDRPPSAAWHLDEPFYEEIGHVERLVRVATSHRVAVCHTSIAVLDPKAFEEIFRDIDSMRARFPVWSEAAIAAIPFDDATAGRLRGRRPVPVATSSLLGGRRATWVGRA